MMLRTNHTAHLSLPLFLLLSIGCPGEEPADTRPVPDMAPDVSSDLGPDLPDPVDQGPDLEPDMAEDTTPVDMPPENQAPSEPTSVEVMPAMPADDDDLTCTAQGAQDPDGDAVTYVYAWSRDGMVLQDQTSDTLAASETQIGNQIVCIARATDGTATSGRAQSAPVQILAPPFQGTQLLRAKSREADELDLFGSVVDISKDLAVIGAVGEDSCTSTDEADDLCENAGAAFVYEKTANGWSQQAFLKGSNTQASDVFGASVAISGDRIIVGTPREDSCSEAQANNSCESAGAAYIFERQGDGSWMQVAFLKASNASAGDEFARSVDISGDHAIVGAYVEESCGQDPSDDMCYRSGAAYIYERGRDGTWSQVAYLKASNVEQDDRFGWSVAISNQRAIVGAWAEAGCAGMSEADNGCPTAGAAYIFDRQQDGSWTQAAYLKASNAEEQDRFGYEVDIHEDRAMVGAYLEDGCPAGGEQDNACMDAGAVYLYERGRDGVWSQSTYLKGSNTEAGDQFGFGVAVRGDRVLVGAPAEESCAGAGEADNMCFGAGAAYVFQRHKATTWMQTHYLKASNAEGADQFGGVVSLSDTDALLGARNESGCPGAGEQDNGCSRSGTAYFFE